jgi:hypothetical protein
MMPAGKYYIGDLCYVMHPQWEEFCSLTVSGADINDGEFSLSNGVRIASYSTMYGDGGYFDGQGRKYSVDAGLIGCIRFDDIDDPNAQINGGQVIDFTEPFETSEDGGVISFGNIRIDTKGEDDFDEEEEEYDGEE